jgi:branched-chain amino acid transport system permease protein
MFAQLLVSSLTLGSVYALTALGFAVIYRATRVVNFAQGEMMMIGAMLALVLFRDFHLPYALVIVISTTVCMMLALLVERVAFRPLLGAPQITVLLSTAAVAQIIRSSVRTFHGDDLGIFPPVVSMESMSFFGVRFTALNLLVVAMTAITLAGFAYLFSRTSIGWAMRATAQNQRGAAIVGISVPAIFAETWVIAGGLAALAGILLAPLIIVTPDMGVIANKGFVAAILGGFASLPGAVIGGLLLGLAENLIGVYVTSAFKDVLIFALLILLLLARPSGLFGRAAVDRV